MIEKFDGLDFDDVYLHPQVSNVLSRSDVDLSTTFGGLTLDIPIIASPMKGIVGHDLIVELAKLGGIGILHRFHKSDSARKAELSKISSRTDKFGVAIGLNADEHQYKYALDKGAKIICVDIANGYLTSLHDFCKKIAKTVHSYNAVLMTGNVVCWDGVEKLAESGVDMIRCGIGSGSLCTTRYATGVGKPQLQAIRDCYMICNQEPPSVKHKFASNLAVKIIADGGLYSSGDMAKALAAGADYLMIGTAFAEAIESDNNGEISGMASRALQEEHYGSVKSIEGITRKVKKDKSLDEIVDRWVWGIKSSCTYQNAKNIVELQRNAKFIKAR